MQDNASALQGIFDISPPAAPMLYRVESHALSIIVIALVSLICGLLFVAFIKQRYLSARGKAQRQLSGLQQRCRQWDSVDPSTARRDQHEEAFTLAQILRTGLALQQLSPAIALPDTLATQQPRWIDFTTQLSMACYSAQGVSPQQFCALLEEAAYWLRCWPCLKP